MKDRLFTPQFWILFLMILVAALSRLLTNQLHIWNFTPIAAMALFSGANFKDKKVAFLVPIIAMLITDVFLGFHPGMWDVYGSLLLITCIGFYLRNRVTVVNVLIASLSSSILFFLITNFFVWAGSDFYTHDAGGLFKCFAEAIPFFGNTIAGDLFYSGILFGGYELVKQINPAFARLD